MTRRTYVILSVILVWAAGTASAQTTDSAYAGNPVLRVRWFPMQRSTFEAYTLNGSDTVVRNVTTRTVTRTALDGVPALHVHMRYVTPDSAGNTTEDVVVRASDLALLDQHVQAKTDSAHVRVGSGRITGWTVPAHEPGRTIDRAVDHAVYPNDGLFEWMLGLLPLKEGYRATLTFYDAWTDAEIVRTFHVSGSETLVVAGVPRSTWKVEDIRNGPWPQVVHWVDTRTHETVRQLYRPSATGPEFWSTLR